MRFNGLVLLFVACSGGAFRSALPGDQRIGDLSADESCQLQEEVYDYVDSRLQVKHLCAILAQSFAGLAVEIEGADYNEECDTIYEDCLAENAELEPEPFECVERAAASDCDATIEEFEACETEAIDLLRTVGRRGCAGDPPDGSEQLSQGCQDLSDRCQVFFL